MLVSQQSAVQVNRKVFAVACALLFFSTAVRASSISLDESSSFFLRGTQHVVINMTRVMQGLVLYQDSSPEGSIGYFSSLSQWTWVWRSYVYTAQTLVGDGVVVGSLGDRWVISINSTTALPLLCGMAI